MSLIYSQRDIMDSSKKNSIVKKKIKPNLFIILGD